MTHDELKAYFYDPVCGWCDPYVEKILDTLPNVTDKRIVENASSFMMEAEDEGVVLSPKDAVRLAEYFVPTPLEKIVADLKDAGISSIPDLDRILNQAAAEKTPDYGESKSLAAVEKAAHLERYAVLLTRNPDIILLGRPVFWPELDAAWLKLAVLCEALTKEEQDILTAMSKIADGGSVQYKGNIPLVIFDVESIHEK